MEVKSMKETMNNLTMEESKQFIREHEKKVNATMRALKSGERVSYNLHEADFATGRYTYNEIVNKELRGRVIIARGPNGKAKIVSEVSVSRRSLHAELNLTERVPVKKTEKKWSKR
jgi:hypothetical protein